MTEAVPPIGTQFSRLAAVAPDEPAVTCDGRTLTRGELDSSTNRLARAYADRGVGVGDYVTIALRIRSNGSRPRSRRGSSARFPNRCPRVCPNLSSTH